MGQGLLSHDCAQEPSWQHLQAHHTLPHSIQLALDCRLLTACCCSSSADCGKAVEACLSGVVGPKHICLSSCAVAVVQCYCQVRRYQKAFETRMSRGSQVTVVVAAAGDVLCPLMPNLHLQRSVAGSSLKPACDLAWAQPLCPVHACWRKLCPCML